MSKKESNLKKYGPASIFQVTLVPPYGEVDNVVEAIPKRYKEKEGKREHGRKTNMSKIISNPDHVFFLP